MGSFQSIATRSAPLYDEVAFVDGKGKNTTDTPWYPTPGATNQPYVWVKLKGKDKKAKIGFDPKASVYTLKREIVKQLIAPEIKRRRGSVSGRRPSISQNGVPSESRSELRRENSVSSKAQDYENSKSSLPEESSDVKKEKATDAHHTPEEEQAEQDRKMGLPRPEILVLENRYFGQKLTNNTLKLEVALADIGPKGVYSPDNDNALIIASHPDLDKEPDVPETHTQNPYANIEMTRVGDKAHSKEDENRPVVLHTQPAQTGPASEQAKQEEGVTGEQSAESPDDKLDAEKSLLMHPRPEEMFIRDFSPPQSNCGLCLWILERLIFWVGYAYIVWAGVKLDDVTCNYKLAKWLLVAGVMNLTLLAFYFLSRLIAEYRKRGHPQERLGHHVICLICFLGLLSCFNLAWQIVGSVYIANSNTDKCFDELYTTSFWYIIAQWIVMVLQACMLGGMAWECAPCRRWREVPK